MYYYIVEKLPHFAFSWLGFHCTAIPYYISPVPMKFCFQSTAITNQAAVSICVHSFSGTFASKYGG